jgi:cystathionine beta-lyase/cystathionine gamma-synthase
MERHNASGMAFAEWADGHAAVEAVHYPGLPTHPDHAVAARTLNGYGGMVGLSLRGGAAAADHMLRRLRLASHAPSLGGVETLVSEPRFTSHALLTPEDRTEQGITDGFIRVSLGIEDVEDIIADFDAALGSP